MLVQFQTAFTEINFQIKGTDKSIVYWTDLNIASNFGPAEGTFPKKVEKLQRRTRKIIRGLER